MNKWYRREIRRLHKLGLAHMANFEYDAAHEALSECLELLEECGDVMVLKWKPACQLNMAACAIAIADYATAVALTTEVLSKDQTHQKALYRRAKANCEMRNLENTRDDLIKLKELNSDQVIEEMLKVVEGALADSERRDTGGPTIEPNPSLIEQPKDHLEITKRKNSRMAMMRNVGGGAKNVNEMRQFSSQPANPTFLPETPGTEWKKPPETPAEIAEYKEYMRLKYRRQNAADDELRKMRRRHSLEDRDPDGYWALES